MNYNNKLIHSLYSVVPYRLKNVISTLYGITQQKKRYGSYYEKYYQMFRELQYWSNKDIIEYQRILRDQFIEFALNNSLFYENYDIADKFHEYPLLTKEIVRNSVGKISPNIFNKKDLEWAHTSGTTGSSLVFPMTIECYQREYAFRSLHYEWYNVVISDKPKIATFFGHPVAKITKLTPPFWVYDYVNRWLIFSSYHMTKNNLIHYSRQLSKYNPELIHGYPSSVYLMALAHEKYGRRLSNLKAICLSSETVFDFQRKKIEDVFQTKVYNWYGNTELCANIVECENGELHLKMEHSFVEILNMDDKPVGSGEKGRLICTGFGNYAFPLIRYDIKDVVTLSGNQVSKCGRNGIIVDNIEGRVEDYVVTSDGRLIGRLDHIFKDTKNVEQAQIIQNNIDEIKLLLVVNGDYSDIDEKYVIKKVISRVGRNMKIKIEYVEELVKSNNGKLQFIISNIDMTQYMKI